MLKRASCILLLAGLVPACNGEDLDARSRFIEDTVGKEADGGWDGEAIVVDVAAAGVGGIEVRAAAETTKVLATATFIAVADTFDKANADRSIAAAKATFGVTTDGGVTSVTCPNGTDNGSSKGTDSGCEKLVVSIPLGTQEKPLNLTVRAPRGALIVSTASAWIAQADLVVVDGDIDSAFLANKGAKVSLTSQSGGTVTTRLAQGFAADKITLDAALGAIDTAAVPGIVSGQGRGALGEGFASLVLTSTPKDGRGGRILVLSQ